MARHENVHDLLAAAFRGQRVLVTGHTGFKGSWLALWLLELGADVLGLSLPPPTQPSHFDLLQLRDLMKHREGDVRNIESVRAAFAEARPSIVFHLAAQSLVRYSYAAPKDTFDTNVGGTVNVLECIRESDCVRAGVFVTSDKCYENREWDYAYRENDAMGGHDPYSASKGAAELAIAAYRKSFLSPTTGRSVLVASVRAGNVIGGGDWSSDRLIPDCVRALTAGRPMRLRNPTSVRPWQHVLDPLFGYVRLAERLLRGDNAAADAYNFGPLGAPSLTVAQIADLFRREWGGGEIEAPAAAGEGPHEAKMLRLACDKAVGALGWVPCLDERQTLEWTAHWYRTWHESKPNDVDRMRALSRRQIAEYVHRLKMKGLQDD